MKSKKTVQELNLDLETVIKKMKKLQKKIGADEQPMSMHQLDDLTKLGRKYTKIVDKIAKKQVV